LRKIFFWGETEANDRLPKTEGIVIVVSVLVVFPDDWFSGKATSQVLPLF
jgi:hypothetical protein